jgi:hypothetical protein
MQRPRRIAGPSDLEYERLYMFYERLEQRERLRRVPTLTAIALMVSAPIMLWMFGWVFNQHLQHDHQLAARTSVQTE